VYFSQISLDNLCFAKHFGLIFCTKVYSFLYACMMLVLSFCLSIGPVKSAYTTFMKKSPHIDKHKQLKVDTSVKIALIPRRADESPIFLDVTFSNEIEIDKLRDKCLSKLSEYARIDRSETVLKVSNVKLKEEWELSSIDGPLVIIDALPFYEPEGLLCA